MHTSPFSTSPNGPDPEPRPRRNGRIDRAIARAALRSGQPVFLRLSDGSILGFESYPSDEPVHTVGTGRHRRTHSARELVRATHTATIAHHRPADIGAIAVTVDSLQLASDGTCTFVDAASNTTVRSTYTDMGVDYVSPLALDWAAAFCRGTSGPQDLFAHADPRATAIIDLRTVTGRFYTAHREPNGLITIDDLSESVVCGTRVWAQAYRIAFTHMNQLEITSTDEVTLWIDPVSEVATRGASPSPLSATCASYVPDRPVGCYEYRLANAGR